ncbi:MAG TPA: DUF58 domain-containing protein [Gemmatimonadaceae bacterium]|nr:DUF58 domain-containing protein [Gemmatimonadaceae bacterium]
MNRNQAVDLSAGARFLDPKVLAKIGNLELIARTVVEGFINGLHRSPHLGLSMDFAEHRAYMPGDDIRRIDWRVYGRTERFYVKEFEADTNANFGVLLDISRSMSFASRGAALSKLDYARYLAACLAYFSHRQRDRVGLVTFDEDIVEFVPPSAKHLPIVLHTLDRIESKSQGTLARPLLKIAENFRRRSILLVISDLYEEPRSVLQALDYLRNKGSDIIVMQVLDPAELEFPFDEAASFQDMETGSSLPVIPEYLRDQYRALVNEHVRLLSSLLGENGIDYALCDTSKPLDHALFSYLSNRQRLMRVR